ncbi:MAG: hypothetical protein QME76_06370 [Bacillota bacterium]|nr:hypothetical protein [Bacillota bacterium]
MAERSKRGLLAEIRSVTAEMVSAAQAGESGLEVLASLLSRRRELMDKVDALDRARADTEVRPYCGTNGAPAIHTGGLHPEDALEIRRLLAEIREMDGIVQRTLEARREAARRVLERARDERRALTYLQHGTRPKGGLVNNEG